MPRNRATLPVLALLAALGGWGCSTTRSPLPRHPAGDELAWWEDPRLAAARHPTRRQTRLTKAAAATFQVAGSFLFAALDDAVTGDYAPPHKMPHVRRHDRDGRKTEKPREEGGGRPGS